MRQIRHPRCIVPNACCEMQGRVAIVVLFRTRFVRPEGGVTPVGLFSTTQVHVAVQDHIQL